MVDLQSASTGKRFANYLIDLACFYIFIIIFFAILIAQGIISTGMNSILDRLITLLCYGIFMGLVEAIFKGKTLGKVCTRTRAVNEDGSPISAKTAFLRGLSRAVPFEAFSAFGYPWHDRWTNTIVIDEARSVLSK
jgi:uncharacterized RDD family membrane protein YckC